jgi:hypothetical protein
VTSTLTRQTEPLTAKDVEQLRLIRLKHRWPYRVMAEQIGLPISTLVKVFRGKPSHETTVYTIRAWLASPAGRAAARK